MSLEGILLGTLCMWALQLAVVAPLTAALVRHRLGRPAYVHLSGTGLSEDLRAQFQSLQSGCFIVVDVIVLALAGLALGLMGFWFIGFARKANAWPGVLAFIAASFIGLTLRSAGAR